MNISITGQQTELTLKNQTHILESTTKSTFLTNKLSALKDFLLAWKGCLYAIFYNEKDVIAWPLNNDGTAEKNDVSIAVCGLTFTDEFQLLRQKINNEVSEKTFCEFMRKMAKYSENVTALVDTVENMQAKKIVSMAKSKDSRGNFSYEYSVKDHGNATFTPPPKIKFTIPIFKHIDKCVVFDLDLSFRYNMVGTDETKQAQTFFMMEMLNIDQFVEASCTAVIDNQMEQFTCPKYWGTLKLTTETDEWKYKDVPMSFVGLPEEKVVAAPSGASRY